MELKQLRVLQALGETGSFSAAAERLDYTQPAVSKIVASLERQLGATSGFRAAAQAGVGRPSIARSARSISCSSSATSSSIPAR